jgi:hypothetical protein
MKLEDQKLANASIDEKIDMRIKFIEFLKIKYVELWNKISIHLYFLLLMCINSVDVLAQKETADDLVNEFAASLDSLPNKKNNLAL